MRSERRLKLNRDFRRVFQRGRSQATPRLVLYALATRQSGFRVGFSVSKKVGNAVVRNLTKRRLRACFDELGPLLENQRIDFVVVCRSPAADASYQQLFSDLTKLLRRGKFMV